MNLYDIDAGIAEAFNAAIDPETGEIMDESMAERFEQLQIDRDQKIENTACLIKNLRAEAAALKAERDALAARQKAAENKAESLSRYLAGFLNGEKFKSTRAAVSWRKSETLEVTDILQIPDEYLTYDMPKANKTAIKAAIKAGTEVPGVQIVQNMNMSIK